MAKQEDIGNADENTISKAREELEAEIMKLTVHRPILTFDRNLEKSDAVHNKKRSEDDVARAWMKGDITKSDLFILEAVYRMPFSTVEMIADMLKLLKLQNPDKLIPVVSVDAVKVRVIELCNNGLLGGCKYHNTDSEKSIIVYACMHNGFRLLNKQFGYYVHHDDMLLALNDMEIFARTAANYCALALAMQKKDEFEQVRGFGEDRSFGKEFRPQLYSHVRLCHADGSYQKIAFEVMYHNYDTAVNELDDIRQRQLGRLNLLLKRVLECENVLHEEPKVVIVCEDRNGIARAFNLIHQNIPELEPYVSYTTEMVVRTFKIRNDGSVANAFLRLKNDEKGINAYLDEM